VRTIILSAVAAALLGGCAAQSTCPRVIYLDGAGWYGGDRSVRSGLRKAGFAGTVERFEWSSLLGPLPDHVTAGANHPKVAELADRITQLRRARPDCKIVLIGLSAGTGIIVNALERLPTDVTVDHVVLLSPSVSDGHNLSEALKHIDGRLYATSSPHDALLAAASSAGMERGRPAGRKGFKIPRDLDINALNQYRKLVHLPWRPAYVAYGWDGRHVSVTNSDFIRVVIAPRIMEDQPYPLDRPAVAMRR